MIHGRRPHAPCRGAACRSRRCTNDWNNVPLKRHAPIASVAALSERHAHPRITERPRRPHAPCRGAACRSRQCTPDSYWLPLKWYTPIASVAAFSERLVHLQIMPRKFIGMRLPSLSLRGPEGTVAISQYPAGSQEGRGENATACPRLPRRPLASSQ